MHFNLANHKSSILRGNQGFRRHPPCTITQHIIIKEGAGGVSRPTVGGNLGSLVKLNKYTQHKQITHKYLILTNPEYSNGHYQTNEVI